MMSVRLTFRPSLKILVTTGPIGFYSSENIPTGPLVVLGYFLWGWDTPKPPKSKKITHNFSLMMHSIIINLLLFTNDNFFLKRYIL